ncbi:MAG TPA: VWA domain-containing protein [Thermoanaerobaculia bacterium]|nr:VWA domain-containing protein [Thermoanaerobaculia bacterium]
MIAALAAVLLLAAPPQASETIEVSIVNVDVVVTDRKGNPVRGLTQDDFEIRDAGKPQAITNFAEYSSAAVENGPAAPPEKRTVVLFIEAFALPRYAIDPLFAAMRDAVKKIVRPGDAVAIYTWVGFSTLLRAGFTDDVGKLDDTLAEIAEESIGSPANELAAESREIAFEHAFHNLLEEPLREEAPMNVDLYKIRRKSEALQSVMKAISGAEGKKIVITATNRFGMYAGADRFPEGVVPLDRRSEFDTRPFREAVARTANAYGITIYPIYPAGMQWTPRSTAEERTPREPAYLARDNNILMNETSALQELAAATGGIMAWGAKDAVSLLPRVVTDLDSYYSLAYRGTASNARTITVHTANRNHVVRMRNQIVPVDDVERLKDRVLTNLHRPQSGATLTFDATAGGIDENGEVPVTIRIPIAQLTTIGGKGAFSVFVAAGGELGILTDVAQRSQPFTIDEQDAARARESHFTYELRLRVDNRTERISVGVFDETGRNFGLRLLVLE